MPEPLDAHYRVVSRAISEGRVVPFLGASANLCGRPLQEIWDCRRCDYLLLLSSGGVVLAEDDDSGGGLDAMIDDFALPETGTYAIIAHGYDDASAGGYTLTLVDG